MQSSETSSVNVTSTASGWDLAQEVFDPQVYGEFKLCVGLDKIGGASVRRRRGPGGCMGLHVHINGGPRQRLPPSQASPHKHCRPLDCCAPVVVVTARTLFARSLPLPHCRLWCPSVAQTCARCRRLRLTSPP